MLRCGFIESLDGLRHGVIAGSFEVQDKVYRRRFGGLDMDCLKHFLGLRVNSCWAKAFSYRNFLKGPQ